jgi:hypothetical protein
MLGCCVKRLTSEVRRSKVLVGKILDQAHQRASLMIGIIVSKKCVLFFGTDQSEGGSFKSHVDRY